MIAVLLALARANRLDGRRRVAREHPRRARRPRGVRGDDRERQQLPRPGRRSAASAPKAAARITPRSSAAQPSRLGAVLVLPDAPRTRRSRCRPTGVRDRRQRRRRAQDRRGARRLQPRVAERRDGCSSAGAARPGRDDVAGRRDRRRRPTRLTGCASCCAATSELLDRFDQFVEESTRARAGRRRSARRRRPRRIRPHRRAVAGARRTAAAQPGAGDRGARRDWPASTARWPPRPSAPASAAASGRSSTVERATRSSIGGRMRIARRMPVGGRAVAVLPDEAGAGSRAVERT